jgi:hypothetical protein
MDDDSFVNIFFRGCYVPNEICPSMMTLVKTLLIGIEELEVPIKGALKLPIIIGTHPRCITLQQPLMVMNMAI